ncbi:MAG: hypothetical protein DSY90_05705 [Deltaproteobacteria bacterium]|nr:MAG: hypothetical protein DSY90_05705 [Deltaproteobacteria bacterium]RUA00139.1 MAG: hypothetical protein DSY89_07135 [Deltaproteobacteria bacterium]
MGARRIQVFGAQGRNQHLGTLGNRFGHDIGIVGFFAQQRQDIFIQLGVFPDDQFLFFFIFNQCKFLFHKTISCLIWNPFQ